MKTKTNKKGFSLIELLVVISIIATVAAMIFGAINGGEILEGENPVYEDNRIIN